MSLSVTVNSASNLPNVDVLDDVSDPYTRITLKGESIICTQSIKYYKQNVILHIILVSLSHVIVVMIRMYWKYKLMNLGKHWTIWLQKRSILLMLGFIPIRLENAV